MYNRELAFRAIVKTHYSNVLNFIFYKVKDRMEAENLASEVFVRASQDEKFDVESANVKSYLLKVAKNLVIDHHRKRKAKKNGQVDLGDEVLQKAASTAVTPSVDIPSEQNDLVVALSAWVKLKPIDAQILNLYLAGYDFEEMSNALVGMQEATIYKRFQRLLSKWKSLKENADFEQHIRQST
ncbi:MAG: RNA polymerase sigma factor [Saprospiraceae bacterium]|nr:RNA polymerase sigma factor [Saprospiraceae bacterium]